MAALVKLNLTAGADTEIYGEEYTRINGETEDFRGMRSVVTQAKIARREPLKSGRAGCAFGAAAVISVGSSGAVMTGGL